MIGNLNWHNGIGEIMYFTYIEKPHPEYDAIIAANKALLGDDFTVFRTCPYDIQDGADIRWKSDVARIMWLRDNPLWRWVDADAEVKIIYPWKPEKTMFYNIRGDFDPCAIYGNGDNVLFEEILEAVTPSIGWLQSWLNSNRNKIDKLGIPKGEIDHKALNLIRQNQ